jgi:hypothetical protein
LNSVFVRGFKDYLFGKVKDMFGTDAALRIGFRPVLNSGIFYLEAQSPIWDAWRNTISKANLGRHQRSDQICDQTCLQVAIVENGLEHAILSAIYKWLPKYCVPVFDKKGNIFVDSVYPNNKIYVIHMAGAKNGVFSVPTSDGTYEEMTMRWPEFSRKRLPSAPAR